MNVDRWLYKISKILRKCTRHVNASEVSYPVYGHQMVRSRASTIATNKGLGTALLIAPPVLILIAAGIATTSILRAPPPADHNPPDITVTPTSSIPPAKDLLSGIQSQLQSIVTVEKRLDHTTTVVAAVATIGFIGLVLVVRVIRRRQGGGGGGNGANKNHEYPRNNMYRDAYVQTGSQPYEENSTLNVGSGGDSFQP